MAILNNITLNGEKYYFSEDTSRSTYEEKGDMYTLLSKAEIAEMAKAGYRIYKYEGSWVENPYANNTIHYYDQSKIGYERVLVRLLQSGVWSCFFYYDPTNQTYTELKNVVQGNAGALVQFDNIPEGCYLAISSPNANYTTGKVKYLGRIWINPNYVPKFDGLDEPISDQPIPVELAQVDYQGFPYFYIDLSKYENMVVRLVRNSGAGTSMAGFYYSNSIDAFTGTATYFSFGNFSPWIYNSKYLIFFFRTNDFVSTSFDLTLGWINPEVAVKQKKKKYFGTALASHNCDTKNLLVPACVWGDIIDIDICRTLDGHYVCIHGTTINGHTIPQTNLEDMELTYNQLELDEAIEIMQMYGSTCYLNIRETKSEQFADVLEKTYAKLGRAVVYDSNVLGENNPLYGHVSKFYCWKDSMSIENIVAAGFKIEKVIADKTTQSTQFNYHDWIPSGSVSSPSSANDIPKDGSIALCFIASNIENILNG